MPAVDDPLDLGGGDFVELQYRARELDGMTWWHRCGEGLRDCYVGFRPQHPGGWEVVVIKPLTLSPSLRCCTCRRAGHIVDGRWIPLR